MNKSKIKEILSQINTIANLNDKLADFYTDPNKISDIRKILFIELNKLKRMIK